MSNSASVRSVRIFPQTINGLTHTAVSAYFESQGISINSTVRHANHFTVVFSQEIVPELVLGNRVINNIKVVVTREPSGEDNSPYRRATGSSSSMLNQSMRPVRQQAQRQTGPNTTYAYQQNLIPQSGLDVTRGAAQAQMSENPCMNPNSRVGGAQYTPMQQIRGNVFLNPAQIRPPQQQFIQAPSPPNISAQIQPPQYQFTQDPSPPIISIKFQPTQHQFTQAPPSQIISVPFRIQFFQAQSSQVISVPIRIQLTQDLEQPIPQHPPPTHHQADDVHEPSGASSTSLASGNAFLHISDQTQTAQVQRTRGQPQLTEIQPTQSQAHQQVYDDFGSFKASQVNVTRNEVHDESEASSKK